MLKIKIIIYIYIRICMYIYISLPYTILYVLSIIIIIEHHIYIYTICINIIIYRYTKAFFLCRQRLSKAHSLGRTWTLPTPPAGLRRRNKLWFFERSRVRFLVTEKWNSNGILNYILVFQWKNRIPMFHIPILVFQCLWNLWNILKWTYTEIDMEYGIIWK